MTSRPEQAPGIVIPFIRPIFRRRGGLRQPIGSVVNLRSGPLEVRLAATPADVDAAQALRYRVFYEMMKARPTAEMTARQRDFDVYDRFCDHLLVIDHELGPGAAGVVGTYRLIRRQAAARVGQFYSEDEYNLRKLTGGRRKVLELGRSCVDLTYRRRPIMQLLWTGISQYISEYDISLMFGCASFPSTDVKSLALPLSYLYHKHLAPPAIRPRAVRGRYRRMDLLPAGAVDERAGQAALPPLIKGYLRLGGFVGDGAVVDEQFNTTDVCIVVRSDWVTQKYQRHYRRYGATIGADARASPHGR